MRRNERGNGRVLPPGEVRREPDDPPTAVVAQGAPRSVGTAVCLVHDHPEGTRPPWLVELASACRLVEVHPKDSAGLRRFHSWPWLVDVRAFDDGLIADLGRCLSRPRGPARLIAVDRDDMRAPARAAALGATDVLLRPIEARSIIDRIFGPRRDADAQRRHGTSGGDETSASDRIEALIARVVGVLERFSRAGNRTSIDAREWRATTVGVLAVLETHGLDPLLDAVRQHHSGTHQHALLVMAIAVALGHTLGLAAPTVERLALGGLLHDIGKCAVPEEILTKPGNLTPDEFEQIRTHPGEGWRRLNEVSPPLPRELLELVLRHHERLDGSGYPDGLRADAISEEVRLLSICDVYGALVERRCYRPPLSPAAALGVVRAMVADGKLDAAGVEALASLVSRWRRSVRMPRARSRSGSVV